jgi:hypothetical protein
VTIPQFLANRVKLGFGDEYVTGVPLKADGESQVTIKAEIVDVNDNRITTMNSNVKFTVEGEGNIISNGTELVSTYYADIVNGVVQITVKSTTKTGVLTIIAESMDLQPSSMTITTVAGTAAKLSFVPVGASALIADGISNVKLNLSVKDVNDNIVTNYPDRVSISAAGPVMILTSTSVYPVNGETELVIRAQVQSGTGTITAKTGNITGTVDIPVLNAQETSISIIADMTRIRSGDSSVLTVRIIDKNGNQVPAIKTVTLTGQGRFSQSVFDTLADGSKQVLFTGTKSGSIDVVATSTGLVSGVVMFNVTSSTQVTGFSVTVSTPVYVLNQCYFKVVSEDGNNNKVVTYNTKINVVVTDSDNELVVSTVTDVINGEAYVPILFESSDLYQVKVTMPSILYERTVQTAVLVNKSMINVVRAKTEFGDVKLSVPAGLFDSDIILKIVKPVNVSMSVKRAVLGTNEDNRILREKTVVEIVAQDSAGSITPVTFPADKYITMTLPYPDKEKPFGTVDGTSFKEENLRVWEYDTMTAGWKIFNAAYTLEAEFNNVTVQLNKLGVYALMGVGTDPTIEKQVVYPNPFTDNTKFCFRIGSQGDVKIEIYTLSGRLIKKLVKQVLIGQDGDVVVDYDGTDDKNESVSAGTYIYKITAVNNSKQYTAVGKFTKMKQ